MNTFERVRKVLAEATGVPEESISLATTVRELATGQTTIPELNTDEGEPSFSLVVDSLKMDSLTLVEIILALEDNFSIEIPDDETEPLSPNILSPDITVQDLVNWIDGKPGV